MISSYSINSQIKPMVCKTKTRDATVLCAMSNTITEPGNTPEWGATSNQAATKWHERDEYYDEAEQVPNATYYWAEALPRTMTIDPFLSRRTMVFATSRLANAPNQMRTLMHLHAIPPRPELMVNIYNANPPSAAMLANRT